MICKHKLDAIESVIYCLWFFFTMSISFTIFIYVNNRPDSSSESVSSID
jgi:hypothetical protein